MPKTVKRVVLAYSGGLDTSVILRWLIETSRCEVVAYCADLGQGEELIPVKEKALRTGASMVAYSRPSRRILSATVFPMLRANRSTGAPTSWAPRSRGPLIAKAGGRGAEIVETR
jgi:argininosuccinate synthase